MKGRKKEEEKVEDDEEEEREGKWKKMRRKDLW